ncbi:MAG: NAD(P)-dependent oxidoreductase [Deltaproteobacteria bacterium]|nr:NAD(P)-dependent oxidoreductase [Deltaproteobacteria bacterium]
MQYDELIEAFKEIEPGYSPQEAVAEAFRCLKCQDAPCAKGCPAGIDVSKFIRQITTRNFRGAIRVIKEENVLAGICARICPQSHLCEGECSSSDLAKPIRIGMLQRFAADQEQKTGTRPLRSLPDKGVAMAVVGSGPAGLTAATFLRRLGYTVDLYDAGSHPGGVLMSGIPAYRLPKAIVSQEVDYIRSLGVTIHTAYEVEDPVALLKQYRAIFLGTGVSRPLKLNIEGEGLPGVIQAMDLLKAINTALIRTKNLTQAVGEQVVVIGGGNAAMDAAVSARKLGAKSVTVVYRRTETEMPAWPEEIAFARKQGVVIKTLIGPAAFIGEKDRLSALRCIQMELGSLDHSGRKRPVPVSGSEYDMPCDTAIIAIGVASVAAFGDLETDSHGLVKVDDETLMTSVPGLFAGGDLIRGSDMAVTAVGGGKRAAFAMDRWIQAGS